jgi:integrase
MKLTTAAARALTAPGKYADGHGLFLHIVTAEKRYWIFRFKRHGRERVMSLGNAADLSLVDARKLHARERAILLAGGDPLAARIEAKQEKRQREHTFAAAASAYIEAHSPGWRCPTVVLQWRQSLGDYALPKLGKLPVGEIVAADLVACLSPLWSSKSATAFKLRSRIEAILDYAIAMGWRAGPNPAVWRGGLRSLLPKPAKVHTTEHHAALDWRQAPAFMQELTALDTGNAVAALRFVILTAARSCEVIGARWEEISIEEKLWSIPAARMKMQKPHRVPLSEAALALLLSIPRNESPFVFSGRFPGRCLCRAALATVLHRLRREDITSHGMRSCFRDWCADTGKPGDLAEAALAHSPGDATVQAYARSDMLERRRALMDEWGAYLTRSPAEVVPIRATG